MRKFFVVVMLFCLLAVLAAFAEQPAAPQKGNNCYTENVVGKKGVSFPVKVYLTNVDTLAGMQVPIKFASEGADLRCDSITFRDSRCAHFEMKSAQIDSIGRVAYFTFIYMTNPENSVSPLMPGTGQVATLWFSVKNAIKDAQVSLESGPKAFLHNEYGIDQSFLFWTPKALPVDCSYQAGKISIK